uniref:Uncharacterized protein n=1 Tax=Timema shepardi TaxID=629360 RepID=A0A7R9B8Z8_TIMSH|nr:unnamed protein product [Timema shepardi]
MPDVEPRNDDLLSSRLSYRRGPPRHTVPDGPQLVLSRGRDPLLVPGPLGFPSLSWTSRLRRGFSLIWGDWAVGSLREGFVKSLGILIELTFTEVFHEYFFNAPVGLASVASPVPPPNPTSGDPGGVVGEPTTAALGLAPRGRLGGIY